MNFPPCCTPSYPSRGVLSICEEGNLSICNRVVPHTRNVYFSISEFHEIASISPFLFPPSLTSLRLHPSLTTPSPTFILPTTPLAIPTASSNFSLTFPSNGFCSLSFFNPVSIKIRAHCGRYVSTNSFAQSFSSLSVAPTLPSDPSNNVQTIDSFFLLASFLRVWRGQGNAMCGQSTPIHGI